MVQAYSMEGFDLRIDSGILEMRTEGERTVGKGRDVARAFEHFLASRPVRAVMFDVRGAQYALDDREWEERAHGIARLCRALPIAIIDREDQSAQTRRVIELHARMDGTSQSFRSRAAARKWLRQFTAVAAAG
jgi:hypothetical protein